MKRIKYILMWPVFLLLLKPLIRRNYRLREESALSGDGKYPDEWYWADEWAAENGFLVRDKS